MNIIRAKINDAKDIAKIEMNSGYKHYKSFDALKNTLKLLKEENLFVAKDKGKAIGYISLKKNKNVGEISFFAVIKKFQNKGFGTKLAKFALNYALKIKCKKIVLSVKNTNLKAIALYNKWGFIIKRKLRRKNKKYVKLIMEKKL